MQRPEDVKLSREEGEALIERLESDTLTADDRCVLAKLIQFYFWLLFALKETKLSLKRLRTLLFGEKPKRRSDSASGDTAAGGGDKGKKCALSSDLANAKADGQSKPSGGHLAGQGRLGADAYVGAERLECRHDELSPGDRCPLCGYGNLYRLPAGVAIRIDGNPLLTAIRYELEKLRCSACGAIFSAKFPHGVGADKYNPRARATLALGRYLLGLPFYRLESYQAMQGVPVSDATQWDQIEALANGIYPVYERLLVLAAQGEVIYQDDTAARLLDVMRANRQASDIGGWQRTVWNSRWG